MERYSTPVKSNAKKKNHKKIENRKMYLQVVHYYDQKAQRHLLLYNTCTGSRRNY